MSYSRLLGKLLAAIMIPTVLTFAGFGYLCHVEAERALEAELGRRLSGIAAAAAAQIGEDSVTLLGPGDEGSRTYRNLRRKLTELRDATGVARIYLFDQSLRSRVDTEDVPIGTRYYGLDISRAELRRAFAGRPASSLLFRGKDGKLYKSGFASIASQTPGQTQETGETGQNGEAGFAVGVDGNAALYQDLLALRRTLLFVGSLGVLAMVILATALGRRLVRPLSLLTQSARDIGQGLLGRPLPAAALSGRDEVAVLAQGLEAMRQGLSARDERLQMMLSGIAHEVRNPLGGIELFTGLLRDELTTPSADATAGAGYVARIEKEIHHLKAVVSDFLEYARRPPPELVPTDIPALLAEVLECVRAAAPPTVELKIAAPPAPGGARCVADPVQLRRALLNLTHNAVQACGAGDRAGSVTIGWRAPPHNDSDNEKNGGKDPDDIEIFVADTGTGIDKDVLSRMWTPFYTTRQKGTGLGLAFVKEIVADHGGSITVDTGPAGTTFVIALLGCPPGQTGKADGKHPDHR